MTGIQNSTITIITITVSFFLVYENLYFINGLVLCIWNYVYEFVFEIFLLCNVLAPKFHFVSSPQILRAGPACMIPVDMYVKKVNDLNKTFLKNIFKIRLFNNIFFLLFWLVMLGNATFRGVHATFRAVGTSWLMVLLNQIEKVLVIWF